jgi:aminotransferase
MPEPSSTVRCAADAASIRVNTRVYELQRQGIDIIVLSLGEAHFDLPLLPLDPLPHPHIFHYSHSRGIPELRAAVGDYYRDAFAVPVDPQQGLLITAGSKAAIHFAMMAVLEPGDDVIIPEPAWVSYREQARLCGANAVMLPPATPISEYARAVTTRTRLLVINNPNNPSGRVYTAGELEDLLDLARCHDFFILADEAYSDFAPADVFTSLGRLDPQMEHAIICNSISKTFGLSGWRIGYVIARADLIDQILKINQHIITCAPTILQHYVAVHFQTLRDLTAPQIRAVLDKRRAVADIIDSLRLTRLPGAATFYFFLSIQPSSLGSEVFCTQLLENDRISAVPGLGYGPSCDSFIRISIGAAPLERIEYALQRIRHLIGRSARHVPVRHTQHA